MLNLGLESVQLTLHIPIDISKSLLGRIEVGFFTLYVCEGWDHSVIEFLNLGHSLILASNLVRWRALGSNFAKTRVSTFCRRLLCC